MYKSPINSIEKDLEEAEAELIRLSGVACETTLIPVGGYRSYSIFCLKCGSDSNPPLVLLHGYMGTSIIFFKILPALTAHYKVFCLDLMGMGRSSRPVFCTSSSEEAELFFVMPLELCRIHLKIDKMILAGHSFGGYIAGCYSERFPQYIEKLVYISGVGIPRSPFRNGKEWMKSLSWKQQIFYKIIKYLARNDITPAEVLRKLGPFGSKLVSMYVKKKWKKLSQEEMKYMQKYIEAVNLYPGSGEFAFKQLFHQGIYAEKPLCDRIRNLRVLYIYGDNDWMDPVGAEMNAEVNRERTHVEFISGSRHHLHIDNPKELGEKIISGLRKLDIQDINIDWSAEGSEGYK